MKLTRLQKFFFLVFICLGGYAIFVFLKFQLVNMMFMDKSYGPLKIEETKNIVRFLPIYDINRTLGYKDLETRYYFFDDGAEVTLFTYFVKKNELNEKVREARLFTYNLQSGLAPYERENKEVTVKWALNQKGEVCKILSNSGRGDHFSGKPYQTCFYWYDNEGYYKIYTIWSEEETEEFVNSLIRVK